MVYIISCICNYEHFKTKRKHDDTKPEIELRRGILM